MHRMYRDSVAVARTIVIANIVARCKEMVLNRTTWLFTLDAFRILSSLAVLFPEVESQPELSRQKAL